MSIINANPLLAAAGGDYQISRSVRLRSSASAYFNRTPASATDRKTWTWSGWVKRGLIGGSATYEIFMGDNYSTSFTGIRFYNDSIYVQDYVSGSKNIFWQTSAVFRDPSAWYHLVVKYDTTQASSTNAVLVYVNGVSQTLTFTANTGAYVQNYDGIVNSTSSQKIGALSTLNYFDGYLTEVNFIDGQALTPSSFGENDTVTGVWKPKKYTGTYGTNGFYLNFSDNSNNTAATIGKDYSGNGNNWTPNNISVTSGVTYDSMLDVPTQWADGGNGRGNYCVLNPLDFTTVGTISEANLRFTQSSSAARSGRASIGVSSGKWYWEVTNLGGNNSIGVQNATASLGTYCGGDANGWSYFIDGNKYNNGSATSYGASYTTNDVIGVALDMDAGTLTFYKNGTSQGTAFSSLSGTLFPAFSASSVSSVTLVANFGQRPFAYTPPTGFKALNTQNLPAPTILKGNQYFDAVTYSGNGGNQSITTQFAPDFAWFKSRSNTYLHALVDKLRSGVDGLLVLYSNNTNAEATGFGSIGSFSSSGFDFVYNSNFASTSHNRSSDTDVAWLWKESATAGFDIVTYTGTGANRTVAHSLGVAPKMIIIKQRDGTGFWVVGHTSLTWNSYLRLNDTTAIETSIVAWNNTAPTSSVFSLGTSNILNGSGNSLVAYLFAEVAGFSRFGSYTGNGSTDGPFVFTGFLPRWVMIKNATGTASANTGWYIFDAARNTVNTLSNPLRSDLSDAESSGYAIDFLSNGFKLRISDAGINSGAGATHIFAAFAESPFRNSLAR